MKIKNNKDLIKLIEEANSIDYTIYNSLSKETKLNKSDFKTLKQEEDDFSPSVENNVTIKKVNIILMFYFLHLAKTGKTFLDEDVIKKTLDEKPSSHNTKLLEQIELSSSKNEQPFYNITRTYWTLKALISYIDSFSFVIVASKMMEELELTTATYFFPSMGGEGHSHSERQNNTKTDLSNFNVFSNEELDIVFTQMPLYKLPSPKSNESKGGCFIATATYESPNSKEVLILRQWRDEYLLHSYFGRIFVKIYYVISPSIAKVIKKYKILKDLSKLVLKPIINYVRK